jgi:DNA-binding MarR family transcriptional regulator
VRSVLCLYYSSVVVYKKAKTKVSLADRCIEFDAYFIKFAYHSMKTENIERGQQALELGRLMSELKNNLRKHVQFKIKENSVDMTFEMLEVMGCLWKQDGVNQQEIADLTLRDKSSMTYLLDNLVKRNMVKRMEDENDRRNKLIYLTDEGLAVKEKLFPWLSEVYGKASVQISEDALKNSMMLINQMIANLKHK